MAIVRPVFAGAMTNGIIAGLWNSPASTAAACEATVRFCQIVPPQPRLGARRCWRFTRTWPSRAAFKDHFFREVSESIYGREHVQPAINLATSNTPPTRAHAERIEDENDFVAGFLTLSAIAAHAEDERVNRTVFDMDCAPCAHAIHVSMKGIQGVDSRR